jgi:hypothetical protein
MHLVIVLNEVLSCLFLKFFVSQEVVRRAISNHDNLDQSEEVRVTEAVTFFPAEYKHVRPLRASFQALMKHDKPQDQVGSRATLADSLAPQVVEYLGQVVVRVHLCTDWLSVLKTLCVL